MLQTKSIIQFLHKHGIVLLVLCIFIMVGSISSNSQLQYDKLKRDTTKLEYEGSNVSKQNAKEIAVLKQLLVENKEEHQRIISLIEDLKQ